MQHSLPEDEHEMFETCRRQEELNYFEHFLLPTDAHIVKERTDIKTF